MERIRKFLTALLLAVTLLAALPVEAAADMGPFYARPPALTFLVYGAPKDVQMRIIMHRRNETFSVPVELETRLWEKQFRLYRESVWQIREWFGNAYDFKDAELVFIDASGERHIPIPEGMLKARADEEYLTYYYRSGTLKYGLPLWRAPLLMSMRILLAIAIEAFFFYRAGFLLPVSWLKFFLINVFTHGLLALLCNGWINVQPGVYALYFIALFLAFTLETVLFLLIVDEQDSNKTMNFLAKANLVSMAATFFLIFKVPI